jgi:hypothetical protein
MAVGAALQEVSRQLGQLTLKARATAYDPGAAVPYERARRPGLGTQGRAVMVLANHFAVRGCFGAVALARGPGLGASGAQLVA